MIRPIMFSPDAFKILSFFKKILIHVIIYLNILH